ncbi:MAG: hypothetical protein WDZ88_02935 [Candidatus Paceibacterota bacterium]
MPLASTLVEVLLVSGNILEKSQLSTRAGFLVLYNKIQIMHAMTTQRKHKRTPGATFTLKTDFVISFHEGRKKITRTYSTGTKGKLVATSFSQGSWFFVLMMPD